MRYVPYGGGAQFEMAIKNDTAKPVLLSACSKLRLRMKLYLVVWTSKKLLT